MSLLLDTHVVLWWLTDARELSDDMKQQLDDEPAVYLSPATVWEITIKQSIGKLTDPENLPEIVVRDHQVLPDTSPRSQRSTQGSHDGCS